MLHLKKEKVIKMTALATGMYDMVWEAHSDHLKELMKIMMMSRDSAEVTLVCDDEKQIKAHKVILSASSSFFKSVLENSSHPNPIIYLRGIDSVEMDSLLQFIYLGQASVCKSKLDQFVKVAKDLKVKELTENDELQSRVQNYQNYSKHKQKQYMSVMKPNQHIEQKKQHKQEKLPNQFSSVMKPNQYIEQRLFSQSQKDTFNKEYAIKLEAVVKETLHENSIGVINPFKNARNDENQYIPVAKQSTQVSQEFIPGSKQFASKAQQLTPSAQQFTPLAQKFTYHKNYLNNKIIENFPNTINL